MNRPLIKVITAYCAFGFALLVCVAAMPSKPTLLHEFGISAMFAGLVICVINLLEKRP